MQIIKCTLILILLSFISACSTPVNKGFLQNFNRDSQLADSKFSNHIVSIKYSNKEKILLVSHESGKIDIWNTNSTKRKQEINAHKYSTDYLAFTSDEKSFFTSSVFENSTKLWDTGSGEMLHKIRDMAGPVGSTPSDDVYVIANSSSRYVRLFDTNKKLLLAEKYACEGVIKSLATHATAGLIAIGTESGTIELWKYSEAKGVPSMDKVSSFKPYGLGDWVIGLKFSTDGKSLYSVTRFGSIDEWSSSTLKKSGSLSTDLKYINSAAFSHNGNSLGLAGTEEKVGSGPGSVVVISLVTGSTKAFRVNTNLAVIEHLPSIFSYIAALNRSVGVFALPAER